MKTAFLQFFISLAAIATMQAQWTSQVSGTTSSLVDVFFTSNMTGYVVGLNGVILKTTDGGQHWMPLNSNTTRPLWSVHFISSDTGFVVGDSVILKTVDGGATWQAINAGIPSLPIGRVLQPYNEIARLSR